MDHGSLHDEDIYAWAEQQAAALRRAAALPNGAPPDLDLENLAEEISDLGRSELRATTSPMVQALAHMAKLAGDPASRAALRWSGDAVRFLLDTRAAYAPSMRRLIDLDQIWRDAVRLANTNLRDYGVEDPPDFPADCPFGIDDLLGRDFDVADAVRRIRSLSG